MLTNTFTHGTDYSDQKGKNKIKQKSKDPKSRQMLRKVQTVIFSPSRWLSMLTFHPYAQQQMSGRLLLPW